MFNPTVTRKKYDDIALLELSRAAEYKKTVRPGKFDFKAKLKLKRLINKKFAACLYTKGASFDAKTELEIT
jgi:hypothetical protein